MEFKKILFVVCQKIVQVGEIFDCVLGFSKVGGVMDVFNEMEQKVVGMEDCNKVMGELCNDQDFDVQFKDFGCDKDVDDVFVVLKVKVQSSNQ